LRDEYRNECHSVVDDESAVRAVAESILVRAGYVVLSAKDGVEGLTVFKQHQRTIGLLLSDVMMPNMNGVELANRVLELDSRMPVIFMSGNMQADRGWGYVAKPFTANELVSNVRQALAIRIQRRVEAETRAKQSRW
jgi:two-component system response regulator SaeR